MKTAIQTAAAPAAIGAYSQAVRAGDTVYLSGQIGLDRAASSSWRHRRADRARVRQPRRSRASGGPGPGSAVRMTVYLTDLAHFAKVNEIMARHVAQPFPARAAVGVASLPRGALVEIDAICTPVDARDPSRDGEEARPARNPLAPRPGAAPAAPLRGRDAAHAPRAGPPGSPVLVEAAGAARRDRFPPEAPAGGHCEGLSLRFLNFYAARRSNSSAPPTKATACAPTAKCGRAAAWRDDPPTLPHRGAASPAHDAHAGLPDDCRARPGDAARTRAGGARLRADRGHASRGAAERHALAPLERACACCTRRRPARISRRPGGA